MKIVVLIKGVPGTWGRRKLKFASGPLPRAASESVVGAIEVHALKVALTYADCHSRTEVASLFGRAHA